MKRNPLNPSIWQRTLVIVEKSSWNFYCYFLQKENRKKKCRKTIVSKMEKDFDDTAWAWISSRWGEPTTCHGAHTRGRTERASGGRHLMSCGGPSLPPLTDGWRRSALEYSFLTESIRAIWQTFRAISNVAVRLEWKCKFVGLISDLPFDASQVASYTGNVWPWFFSWLTPCHLNCSCSFCTFSYYVIDL